MRNRLLLLLVSVFWLTMTYLLWRMEYVGQSEMTSSVSASMVWKKILTAPDTSSMDIKHSGVKIGYCRWASSILAENGKTQSISEDGSSALPPGGIVGYRLDLEGNIAFTEVPGRMRFDCSLRLSTNSEWKDLRLSLNLKPARWEVTANSTDQKVRFTMDDRDGKYQRVFKLSELSNPQTLMDEFNLPPVLGMLGAAGTFSDGKGGHGASLGLEWKAHSDWVMIGHTSVRAYVLEASVFERYRIRIMVSRVGELLKVELPDDWELVNEQLGAL